MNRISCFIDKHKWFIFIVSFFVIVQLFFLFSPKSILWDEAVYIAMGKYFYSGGEVGIFEEIRPPGMPVLLGLFWKLGFSEIWSAKMLAVLFSVLYFVMLYSLALFILDKRIGVISISILILTPLFWKMSYFALTDIPSAVFALLAFYFLISKNKPFLAGLFSSLAFLFRFPSGLIIIILYFTLGYTTWKHLQNQREKNIKKKVLISFAKKGFLITAGFCVLLIPYLIFNYALYHDVTSHIYDAVFRPFLLAAWHQGNPAEAISGSRIYGLFYYVIETLKESPIYLFFLPGILFLIFKKKYLDTPIVASFAAIAIPFLYYSLIINKQVRFSLFFLPYISIISAYGIIMILDNLKNKNRWRYLFIILLFPFIFFSLHSIFEGVPKYHREETVFMHDLQFLVETYPQGIILTSHPAPAAFIDYHFIGNYFSSQEIFEQFIASPDINMLIYSPDTYWCHLDDTACYYEKEKVLDALLNNFNLLYYGIYDDDHLYVFSKNKTITPYKGTIPKYNKTISLSENPDGYAFIVVLRIDDAAAIYREDKKNSIWKFNQFYKITNYLVTNNVIMNWVIIPNDILEMNAANKSFLQEYYKQHKNLIEITQHGYDHYDQASFSEFAGLSYDAQYEKISNGNKILEETFNTTVTSFVPPFNRADDTTASVLYGLNFTVYSSIKGDQIRIGDMNRIDQTIAMEKAMDNKKTLFYSLDELITFFQSLGLYKSSFVFVVHPHSFEIEQENKVFEDFIAFLIEHDTIFMTLSEAANWQEFRNNINFFMTNQTIHIIIDENNQNSSFAEQLTILSEEDESYAFFGPSVIQVRNIGEKTITFCLNDICKRITSGAIEGYNFG